MKKLYILYYASMAILSIVTILPLSVKGILGLIFIVVSCVWFSYKDGLITAALWMISGFADFIMRINVDYKFGMTSMVLGTLMYWLTAHYLGRSIDSLKLKNIELSEEIKRRECVEKELNEKLTLIQSLIDTIPSPIFLKDMNFNFIRCNSAFESSIGMEEGNLKGKTDYDIFPAEQAKEYCEMDKKLLNGETIKSHESLMSFADGSIRNVFVNKAVFRDIMGEPAGIVGVITDISDKKERELLKQSLDENKLIIDEIVKYDKMKTEFFSNISHEFRTPLNVVLGSVQLLEMYTRSDDYYEYKDKVKRNVSIIKQNCFRLLRLINNLIDTTRIDSSSFEIHLANCNIVSIVEDIVQSVSDYIENKGIDFVFDTEVEEKIIACDAEKIERIMLNLLSNAVKFTQKGGKIFIGIYDRGDSLVIQVSDSGIGIPKDKQKEIFDRFYQVENVLSRQHEGSGIGLNLVKSIVELHEGSIYVDSEPGKGTVFTISLPAKTVSAEECLYTTQEKHDHVERIQIEFSDIYSVC